MPLAIPPHPADREIVTARSFPHARDRVFAAWTDPERLARWWGPAGFRNSFETFEPRPGGQWRFTMHGPDGRDYPNHSIFVEVAPPELIVFDHRSLPHFRVIASFEDDGGATWLTFRMRFASPEICADVARYAIPANEQNFDRLAAELEGIGSPAGC